MGVVTCRECGTRISTPAWFCPRCGALQEGGTGLAASLQSPQDGERRLFENEELLLTSHRLIVRARRWVGTELSEAIYPTPQIDEISVRRVESRPPKPDAAMVLAVCLAGVSVALLLGAMPFASGDFYREIPSLRATLGGAVGFAVAAAGVRAYQRRRDRPYYSVNIRSVQGATASILSTHSREHARGLARTVAGALHVPMTELESE